MQPLAERLRPKKLNEFVGQQHLLGENKVMNRLIKQNALHSMILWGPPGVGKTTLASLFAELINSEFVSLSAVSSGVKEIRQVIDAAKKQQLLEKKTILFIDEIHRFNKAQQDALLPDVEQGTFILIGATTENPSFALNNALLSRLRVYALKSLTTEDLIILIKRVLNDCDQGLGTRYFSRRTTKNPCSRG
jgi:putative ATPase